jgi:hypothetical protein
MTSFGRVNKSILNRASRQAMMVRGALNLYH